MFIEESTEKENPAKLHSRTGIIHETS